MFDCIEWTGCRDSFGYGMRKVNGKVRRLHLIAFEEANGPIPEGMVVRPRCFYAEGGWTHRSLGKKYGVGHRTLARAIEEKHGLK